MDYVPSFMGGTPAAPAAPAAPGAPAPPSAGGGLFGGITSFFGAKKAVDPAAIGNAYEATNPQAAQATSGAASNASVAQANGSIPPAITSSRRQSAGRRKNSRRNSRKNYRKNSRKNSRKDSRKNSRKNMH